MAAGQGSDVAARQALATLCEDYWYPLYAYTRRRGYQPAEAQDLTQGFFLHLLEKDALQAAAQTRGRFRSFLLEFAASLHRQSMASRPGPETGRWLPRSLAGSGRKANGVTIWNRPMR